MNTWIIEEKKWYGWTWNERIRPFETEAEAQWFINGDNESDKDLIRAVQVKGDPWLSSSYERIL